MTRPLRALLLAAGLGTRLRPFTLHTPKCLVEINGEPLLGNWLKKLEGLGCEEVLINTHYLAEKVESYVESQRKVLGMRIKMTHESSLLGTAGSLMANKEFFAGSIGLLIHADNAMAGDLKEVIDRHRGGISECVLTMLTFTSDRPSNCGIVEMNRDGVVVGFHEKVENPPGTTANGAIYVFDERLLEELSLMMPEPSDFSLDVLPRLLGRIQTCHTEQPYIDVGTPESLLKAQTEFKR